MVKIFFADSNLIGSRIIRLVTWSEYSHVGFITPDNTVIDSRFSNGGVTEYSVDELATHHSRIKIVEFPHVDPSAINFARTQLGKKYDWTALFGIGLHRDWQETDQWFCSELVAWACEQAGTPIINKLSSRVTPQDVVESSPKQ